MKIKLLFFLSLCFFFFFCKNNSSKPANESISKIQSADKVDKKSKSKETKIQENIPFQVSKENQYNWLIDFSDKTSLINQIPTPPNYKRVLTKPGSYQNWLQFLPLYPKNKKVELFNGELKSSQYVHERVINIDIGKRDLQQCADAVMRLRAEYLFGKKEFEKIHFNYTNGTKVSYDDWRIGKKPIVKGNKVTFSATGNEDNSYSNFKKYLTQIFSYAGTASLEKEMKSVPYQEMQIGDVLIQGGHPGHAILVVDMAENNEGKKIYLLAQSYMPAQNIHVLKNNYENISPWYSLEDSENIMTPEWQFNSNDLKRFK